MRIGRGAHGKGIKLERTFNVIIERDEDDYYIASVPELRGCHTQAKSLDILLERVREAIQLCLEVESDTVSSPEFVGVQRITVSG
jgi:predicted RNase H-like HicB family nuclease